MQQGLTSTDMELLKIFILELDNAFPKNSQLQYYKCVLQYKIDRRAGIQAIKEFVIASC